LSALLGKRGTVIVFVANGCPTARAYEDRLMALHESYRKREVNLVAVNANNAALSPPDSLTEMSKRARERKFSYPYMKDVDGSLARQFGAVCTPHAFVFDQDMKLVYSGRIDDSRLGDRITERDLENAVSDVLAGQPVRVAQTEPFGCSIVW
jgi:hypothetical protein